MRRFGILVSLSLFSLAASADASPWIIPQPLPEPLSLLIAHSKTIQVLRVASTDLHGVRFKTETKLTLQRS